MAIGFSRFEFMIAWRYLRARRAEGGVSVMTWISLIGIALGVMALIATLAVRAGFRAEFVDTILGANAHTTVYMAPQTITNEFTDDVYVVPGRIADYEAMAARLAEVPGVTRTAAIIKGQVMASANDSSNVAEVFGVTRADLEAMPRIVDPATSEGDLARFDQGIAIGSGIARELGVGVGDRIRLIAPEGARTAMGTTPRVNAYEVTYIFSAGRYDIDRTRVYMPLAEAQSYFNREGVADEIEVFVDDPERVDDWTLPLMRAAGEGAQTWSWRDSSGSFLSALDMEDDVMFVILSVLVLIASMNITSGLDHAGQEQGPRHRHPAHDGPDRRVDPAGLLPVRCLHRDHRHDRGGDPGRGPGAERGQHHGGPERADRGRRVAARGTRHLSSARRPAGLGHLPRGGAVADAVLRRDDLSRAPRRAHEPGGGPAL